MANVLNRTSKQYRTSVHTPDFPDTDWVINPDISALGSVPAKHWKINPDDTVVEMTQAEKDAVDNDPGALTALKAQRYTQIDKRTVVLIMAGHTFASKQFSLSENAQRYVGGLKQAVDATLLTPPLDVTTLDDDTHTLADAAAVDAFYGNALAAVKAHLDSGRALKKQIFDAATKAAVDAVVDSR